MVLYYGTRVCLSCLQFDCIRSVQSAHLCTPRRLVHSAQCHPRRSLHVAQTSLEVSGPLGAASLPYAALYSDLRENGKSRLHTRSRRKRRSLVCSLCDHQCTLHVSTHTAHTLHIGMVSCRAGVLDAGELYPARVVQSGRDVGNIGQYPRSEVPPTCKYMVLPGEYSILYAEAT